MSAAALDGFRRLELAVARRLEGRLHGEYEGLLPGHGSELGEARRYEPGDDVRRIDWAVSARQQRPFVRDTIADHELVAVAVVDLSASLDIGTARRTKKAVALDAVGALGFLVAHGANAFGAVALTADGPVRLPPAQGRAHVHAVLRRLAALPAGGGPVDLGAGLRATARTARRSGFVAVVSDFLGRPDWERPLRALGRRHDVLAVEITDPLEVRLPDVGFLTVQDPETGRRRVLDTADPQVRSRYAEATAAHRARVATALRRARADHVRLATDRDWIADLLRHVEARRRTIHLATGAR